MAETVLLAYPAVSKDTVMVTSMKADFFEKKVGVPGVAQDIPACTKAELSPVFNYKTRVEKALYIKGFRHAGRIFDTVLIPNRIINNGRNVKVLAVVFICRRRFGGTQFFISVHTFLEKICYNVCNEIQFSPSNL